MSAHMVTRNPKEHACILRKLLCITCKMLTIIYISVLEATDFDFKKKKKRRKLKTNNQSYIRLTMYLAFPLVNTYFFFKMNLKNRFTLAKTDSRRKVLYKSARLLLLLRACL